MNITCFKKYIKIIIVLILTVSFVFLEESFVFATELSPLKAVETDDSASNDSSEIPLSDNNGEAESSHEQVSDEAVADQSLNDGLVNNEASDTAVIENKEVTDNDSKADAADSKEAASQEASKGENEAEKSGDETDPVTETGDEEAEIIWDETISDENVINEEAVDQSMEASFEEENISDDETDSREENISADEEYKVSYIAGGKGVTDLPYDDNLYHKGDSFLISDTKPKRSGYDFWGWSLNGDSTKLYSPGDSLLVSDNISLTAVWEEQYVAASDQYRRLSDIGSSYKGNSNRYGFVEEAVNSINSYVASLKGRFPYSFKNSHGSILSIQCCALVDYIWKNVFSVSRRYNFGMCSYVNSKGKIGGSEICDFLKANNARSGDIIWCHNPYSANKYNITHFMILHWYNEDGVCITDGYGRNGRGYVWKDYRYVTFKGSNHSKYFSGNCYVRLYHIKDDFYKNLSGNYYAAKDLSEEELSSVRSEEGNELLSTQNSDDHADDAEFKGKCGDELYWSLNDGELTIEGVGEMYDFAETPDDGQVAPWRALSDKKITRLKLNEGLTSIGNNAFFSMSGLEGELKLPQTVRRIGESAFMDCSSLSGELHLPKRKSGERKLRLSARAFENCSGFSGKLLLYEDDISPSSDLERCFYGCRGIEGFVLSGLWDKDRVSGFYSKESSGFDRPKADGELEASQLNEEEPSAYGIEDEEEGKEEELSLASFGEAARLYYDPSLIYKEEDLESLNELGYDLSESPEDFVYEGRDILSKKIELRIAQRDLGKEAEQGFDPIKPFYAHDLCDVKIELSDESILELEPGDGKSCQWKIIPKDFGTVKYRITLRDKSKEGIIRIIRSIEPEEENKVLTRPESEESADPDLGKEYNIVLELNGGTFIEGEAIPASYYSEDVIRHYLKLSAKPEKDGYKFGGWFTDPAFENKISRISKDNLGDHILYAKWIPRTYRIKFDPNDPSDVRVRGICRSQKQSFGLEDPLNENNYSAEGYKFLGWSFDKDKNTADIEDKGIIKPDSFEKSITLYAIWEKIN
ncbi:MAG: InlB B-repeat-containing protein [Lachnospiraceae bacterium]|nr:InlB B-repeat-containing protein [Lachnospiraceae bacterium]